MFPNVANEERIAELERRVARLEEKIDALMGRAPTTDQFGFPIADTEVEQWLRKGNKIEAIKVYRQKTGVGLKEAKDAVEEIERRLR